MEVQILEFTYDSTSPQDVEEQINNYLRHHDVEEVKVTQWEDQLLVFVFSAD